jgi:hypothetical protein
MANIPYPNIPYPRLSYWWVLNLFCDKRYQSDLVLSTIKQHIYAKPVKWSVRLFLDNITLMFLLNFQVEVIINMFIKREPIPHKEHEVNTPYSTSNRGVSVPKRVICEHGKYICICSYKGTESDQNY